MPDIHTIDPAWRPAADLLKERVILITGAANGIGRALAGACGACGATTVLLDRNVRGLESLYDASVAAGHPEPALYPMDLETATPEDYQTLSEVLDREFGRLDGLVHNAALLGALIPLVHYEDELWYRILQTNLNAPYQLTRVCLELLSRPADASIIFSSDATGRHGKAYWGAYAVSKAGIENLMQVLADELAANSGIRVNSLDPGPVHTALRTIAYPGEDRRTLPAPEDVVTPFLYLLGPDSRGISGRQYAVE